MVDEREVVARLREAGRTLALAESMTGGLIAARLTRVVGASEALLGGVVVYTDHAKRTLLGIDARMLAEEGGISAPVTLALARACRERLGADCGVAITGAAGPNAPDGVPVGLYYVGISGAPGDTVHERRAQGDRDAVREASVRDAFELILAWARQDDA